MIARNLSSPSEKDVAVGGTDFNLTSAVRYGLVVIATVVGAGFACPMRVTSPIDERSVEKIDPESFWFFPWGEARVHQGIDIFAAKGTPVMAPVSGIIFETGTGSVAGNYIYILGARWRTYYLAHMDSLSSPRRRVVKRGEFLGSVGNTGNAAGRPYHLHYSIRSLFPRFWTYDRSQFAAWRRTYFIDPNSQLRF